jgi:hypothetical protein
MIAIVAKGRDRARQREKKDIKGKEITDFSVPDHLPSAL